jgi:hypothetical protein
MACFYIKMYTFNINPVFELSFFLSGLFLCKILYCHYISGSRTNGFAPSSPEIGMHVEIRDPEDKIILSKVGAYKFP